MGERDEVVTAQEQEEAQGLDQVDRPEAAPREPTPGDALRALPEEAAQRGTRFISAQAMQARLFSVYDAATAAEEALALVQDQLTLTLNRSYYEAGEIEAMASQLDALLALEALDSLETADAGPAAAGGDPAPED